MDHSDMFDETPDGDILPPEDAVDTHGYQHEAAPSPDHIPSKVIEVLPSAEKDITHERLDQVKDDLGFFVHNSIELQHAEILSGVTTASDIDRKLMVKLEAVERPAIKKPHKAPQPPLSLRDTWDANAKNANAEAHFAEAFGNIIEQAHLAPTTLIAETIRDIKDSDSIIRALEGLLRLVETMTYADTGRDNHLDDVYFDLKNPDMKARYNKHVAGLTAQETIDLTAIVRAHETARAAYWREMKQYLVNSQTGQDMASVGLHSTVNKFE